MTAASLLLRGLFMHWLLCLCAVPALADEINPALLQINEREGGWVDVNWKIPVKQDRGLGLNPVLPKFLEPVGPPTGRRTGGGYVEFSSFRTNGQPLAGSRITVEGLGPIQTDVLLQVSLADGTRHSAILRPGNISFRIPEKATLAGIAVSYWEIGTIHILEGFDHLLFVLALILIVPGWWMLLKTITAFTLAHSITLALATLGLVTLPGPPTEAVIALSILFLAVEIMHSRAGRVSLTERYPWVVALAFGLVHGLGFAGALSEVGLPQQDIPLALLMFNLGVETGQVLFVGLVLAVRALLQWLPFSWPTEGWQVVPYAIGGIASFWLIERVVGFS